MSPPRDPTPRRRYGPAGKPGGPGAAGFSSTQHRRPNVAAMSDPRDREVTQLAAALGRVLDELLIETGPSHARASERGGLSVAQAHVLLVLAEAPRPLTRVELAHATLRSTASTERLRHYARAMGRARRLRPRRRRAPALAKARPRAVRSGPGRVHAHI